MISALCTVSVRLFQPFIRRYTLYYITITADYQYEIKAALKLHKADIFHFCGRLWEIRPHYGRGRNLFI